MDKWLSQSSSVRKREIVSSLHEECKFTPSASSSKEQSSPVCSATPLVQQPSSQPKRRKYDISYLSYGFTYNEVHDNEVRPQCVICLETLSHHSMKPSLLKRHFLTKHESYQNKPLDFFKRKEASLKGSTTSINSFTTLNLKAVEASYKVSLRIAQEGKPHTIGETLILPATKDIVSTMLGEKEAKQIDSLSLSNNTVSRRISDMAANVKETLLLKIKKSNYFAIQIDETTDVTNMAQLICYVRYEDGNTVGEDMLFCLNLPSHTTSDEIFGQLDRFIRENELNWEKCVGICTDGANAMAGVHKGVVTQVQQVSPKAKFIHCSLHREALVTKRCPAELKTVLNEAVKTVNFIKSRALNSRLFHNLCDEMDSIHKQLLLHTEVRWLSRGRVISRVFELRHEILIFLSDTDFQYRDRFSDELWLSRLAYLADIFSMLNDVNRKLQGSYNTPFQVMDKINSVKLKLSFAEGEAKKNKVSLFPSLESFVEENELLLNQAILNDISDHCSALHASFTKYFQEDLSSYSWIKNPFADIEKIVQDSFPLKLKQELFELNCDSDLKEVFNKTTLIDFWIQRRSEYGEIADKAVEFLLPFRTSYLCEAGFSHLLYIKNKYRNRMNTVECDLRLKLSPIMPDISRLSRSIQAHPSH